MQAIAFGKHGAPSVLAKVNVPHPHGFAAANNVLIKVHAASINPVDKIFLKGDMKLIKPVAAFPHVISYDVSGVVEVADSAGKFKVGDAIMARLFGNKEEDGPKTPWFRGAMAEYCVARVENVVPKPDNLSFEEAASIPLAGMTAYQVGKRENAGKSRTHTRTTHHAPRTTHAHWLPVGLRGGAQGSMPKCHIGP